MWAECSSEGMQKQRYDQAFENEEKFNVAEGQGMWNGEVSGSRLRKAWCVQLRHLDVIHWQVP